MQSHNDGESMTETQAAAFGAVGGLMTGAGLGSMITLLMGGWSDLTLIVIVHAMFAMMLMGPGWRRHC